MGMITMMTTETIMTMETMITMIMTMETTIMTMETMIMTMETTIMTTETMIMTMETTIMTTTEPLPRTGTRRRPTDAARSSAAGDHMKRMPFNNVSMSIQSMIPAQRSCSLLCLCSINFICEACLLVSLNILHSLAASGKVWYTY